MNSFKFLTPGWPDVWGKSHTMSKKLLNQFSIEKLKNSQSLDDLGLIIVVAGFKTLPNGDESPNLVTLFEPYFLNFLYFRVLLN